MENRKNAVHVVGRYSPTATGLEGQAESYFFQQLFWKAITKQGYNINLLMGFKGDPRRFNQDYVSSKIHEGDIVVLLNPLNDVIDNLTFRSDYRSLVKEIARKVSYSRMVLAFQDLQAKKVLTLSGLFEIDYKPTFFTHVGYQEERVMFHPPTPEEAIAIVVSMIKGENPDVYAEEPRKAA
jgi:hypothetical protein